MRIALLILAGLMGAHGTLYAQILPGSALLLDGSGDYVLVADDASLDLTSSITIEAWINKEADVPFASIVTKGGTSELTVNNYTLHLDGEGGFFFTGLAQNAQSSLLAPLNAWHHVACVWDGETVRFYVDGVLDPQSTAIGGLLNTNDSGLTIGVDFPGSVEFYPGLIDEVRVWNVARSDDQIRATMRTTLGPAYFASADSGLVGYWRFDSLEDLNGDGVSHDVRDLSVHGNHGTLIDDAQLTPVVDDAQVQALIALYNATDGDNWTNNDNWLTGPVDTWFGVSVQDGLVTGLNLFGNNLTGSIPPELGSLANLSVLSLFSNGLTGSIPPELGNLANLSILRLEDNGLTGSIPPELGNLANLTELWLDTNAFTGSIPPELGNLSNLTFLFLGNNGLTGSIPPALGNLSNLTFLFLGNNGLTGSIPAELGNLAGLIQLGLDDNQLEGSIPSEIENLSNVEVLSLQGNLFVDLPPLVRLTALRELRVQSNRLTFEDIEPNVGVAERVFEYAPQASVGEAQTMTLNEGDPLMVQISVGGANNQYEWFKDSSAISNATSDTYTVASTTLDDAGVYTLAITNTVAGGLTLQSEPITVTIIAEQPSDLTFGVALAPETFRMISIPLRVADPGISSILEDDYGPPDPEQWRLFRWRETGGDYDEHPNIAVPFSPGTAFWLITQNGMAFDVENTLTVRTAQTIMLDQGWNQIGNPFAFPVAWNTVTERGDIEGPWFFDGALNDYRPCCEPVIDPWEGYFVYNNTGASMALVVEPVAAAAARKAPASPSLLSESTYAVQVSASVASQGLRDAHNYAGLAEEASQGRDALDYAEAPPIGDHVRLSLVEDGTRLAGSFKPPGDDGQQWSIEVEAVVEGEVLPRRRDVAVDLIEHGDRPAGWSLYVLDLDAGRILSRGGQRFAVMLENDVRHLSLLMGTEAYAEAHSDGIALVPHEFTLAQNYPNPFNPETVISYSLGERAQVELVIYDVLGRRVRTLIDRVEESGTYVVPWRGRDDSGLPLASGVYVYRLQAGRFTDTRTMMLVR